MSAAFTCTPLFLYFVTKPICKPAGVSALLQVTRNYEIIKMYLNVASATESENFIV